MRRGVAFDEALAKRIRKTLTRKMGITDKKTSGGIVFSLNGNMLVGVWKNSLIVRLGDEQCLVVLLEPHVGAFDIPGRAVNNWILVEPGGIDDAALPTWNAKSQN